MPSVHVPAPCDFDDVTSAHHDASCYKDAPDAAGQPPFGLSDKKWAEMRQHRRKQLMALWRSIELVEDAIRAVEGEGREAELPCVGRPEEGR